MLKPKYQVNTDSIQYSINIIKKILYVLLGGEGVLSLKSSVHYIMCIIQCALLLQHISIQTSQVSSDRYPRAVGGNWSGQSGLWVGTLWPMSQFIQLPVFVQSLELRMVFTYLNSWGRIKIKLFCYMWKLYKIQIRP